MKTPKEKDIKLLDTILEYKVRFPILVYKFDNDKQKDKALNLIYAFHFQESKVLNILLEGLLNFNKVNAKELYENGGFKAYFRKRDLDDFKYKKAKREINWIYNPWTLLVGSLLSGLIGFLIKHLIECQ